MVFVILQEIKHIFVEINFNMKIAVSFDFIIISENVHKHCYNLKINKTNINIKRFIKNYELNHFL